MPSVVHPQTSVHSPNPQVTQMALNLKKKNGPHNKIKNHEPRKETGREEGGFIKVGRR